MPILHHAFHNEDVSFLVWQCHLVFASGRGGEIISHPTPHHTRSGGTKIRPCPAPQRAGPRTGNGAGDH